MAKIIKVKRGLEANRGAYVPQLGEIIWTTDNHDMWIGDGSTAGGLKVTANVEGAYIPTSQKAAANGVATLDASSKIPNAQLPALAITSVFVSSSEATQLSLTAQEGDVCVRTDLNKSYIHNTGSAGTMADWNELLTPTDTVLSVNGQTGAVSLSTSNITEGSNLYYTDARVNTRIAATSINALSDVDTTGAVNGNILQYNGTNWVDASLPAGVTTFTGLTDTPANYTGSANYCLVVNSAGDGIAFENCSTVDGGTF